MDLLARREHSRTELETKLARRFAGSFGPGRRGRQNDVADDAEMQATHDVWPDGGAADVCNARQLIAEALDKLADDGLQSDVRFAGAFVRSRIARGKGPLRIRHELGQRGLSKGLIEAALDAAEVDWATEVQLLLDRKYGPVPPADARERARRARFLQQRGFAWGDFQDFI